MSRRVLVLLAVPAVIALGGLAVLVVAVRTKSPRLLGAVRAVNKACWNPQAMKQAGRPGQSVSIVRHVGRTSGRAYETPVGAQPTGDGFVVALTYGLQADWTKNVLAAGSATIVHDGAEHPVVDPEVVPIDRYLDAFSPSDQKGFRLFGIRECLHLVIADADSAA
jgi:deazaflavin-dependent oxidoreductase (nitroreductase family)